MVTGGVEGHACVWCPVWCVRAMTFGSCAPQPRAVVVNLCGNIHMSVHAYSLVPAPELGWWTADDANTQLGTALPIEQLSPSQQDVFNFTYSGTLLNMCSTTGYVVLRTCISNATALRQMLDLIRRL